MSLALPPDEVESILLPDGWHEIWAGSLYFDSYEYVDDDGFIHHAGGASGICATGFRCKSRDEVEYIAGPMTALLAVRGSVD